MSSALRSEDGGRTSKKLSRQTKSHEDKQSSMDSPSSKQSSYGSSRGDRSKGHKRRRSSPSAFKSSLRETLSSFGDDVVRMKKYSGQYAYDNHGYFQPDISFHTKTEKSRKKSDEESPIDRNSADNELAVIMSHHDPSFQTKHFERVKPHEVGMKSSKWQKLLQASLSSNRFQKMKRQSVSDRISTGMGPSENNFLEDFYNNNGLIKYQPPYWGVSPRTRGKFSFLSLSLILHELACFTSCVLLGCMIFQGMEAVSWVQQKPITENWLLFKWYSSFQTILVVITCIGFLNRVDTTDVRSLWMLPLFLVPVLGLSISDYCNKAWELQRLECFSFFRLDEKSQQKVHLSQDCSSLIAAFASSRRTRNAVGAINNADTIIESSITALTELKSRGTGPLVLRILALLSISIISVYLFCCRRKTFLINLFGPPELLTGNLNLIANQDKNGCEKQSHPDNKGSDKNEDVKVIYKRNDFPGRY